jgi:hypothetical protein
MFCLFLFYSLLIPRLLVTFCVFVVISTVICVISCLGALQIPCFASLVARLASLFPDVVLVLLLPSAPAVIAPPVGRLAAAACGVSMMLPSAVRGLVPIALPPVSVLLPALPLLA